MSQKDLERAQVNVALQQHGRVGRPKFVQEPVLAVRPFRQYPLSVLQDPQLSPAVQAIRFNVRRKCRSGWPDGAGKRSLEPVPIAWRYSRRLPINVSGRGTSRSSQFFGVNRHSGFALIRANCLELTSVQQVWPPRRRAFPS